MKKLTLNGKVMSCLFLICLFLAQACKKDKGYFSETEFRSEQLIQQIVLKKWFENNKNSKLLKLDWNKAQQGIVDGKNVVRIPIISPENLTTKLSTINLKNSSLSSNGLSSGIGNISSTPNNDQGSNYNPIHPPEVFFIQDGPNGKHHSYLLNFVPKDKSIENGTNGVWSGKLLEWNLQGDTILVQELERNKLKSYYAIKPTVSAPSNLSNVVKNNKLQSLSAPSIKDKQVSGFFGWLIDKLGEFAGWVGDFFGLSIHNIYAYDRYNEQFNVEYQLNINFGWLTGGGGPPEGPGTTTPPTPVSAPLFVVYIGAGEPIYQSYISGYVGGGTSSSTGSNGSTGGPDIYHPYPVWNGESIDGSSSGGPNFSSYNLSAQYLINQGWIIGGDNIAYINSNKEVADALVAYIDKIAAPTQSDIDFLNWAIGYLSDNASITIDDLLDSEYDSDTPFPTTSEISTYSELSIDNSETRIVMYPQDIINYPKLAALVNGLYNKVANTPKILAALVQYTGLTQTAILNDLKMNKRGPIIVIRTNEQMKTRNPKTGQFTYPYGKTIDNDTNKPFLFLNQQFIISLESSTGANTDALTLLLATTILHEYVHWAENNFRLSPSFNGEKGELFEKDAFGGIIYYNKKNGRVYYK